MSDSWTQERIEHAMENQSSFRHMLDTFDKAYWQDNIPLIDDSSYAVLKEKYLQTYGDDLTLGSTGGEVSLIRPMLSINNVFDLDGLKLWCASANKETTPEFALEPKVDGLAVRLYYKPDHDDKWTYTFHSAFTRGEEGKCTDVTDNVYRYVTGFPRNMKVETRPKAKGEIYVDGEVYVSKHDKLDTYVGCRQQSFSVLMSKTTSPAHGVGAKFIAYGADDYLSRLTEDEIQLLSLLKVFGFDTVPFASRLYSNANDLWEEYKTSWLWKWVKAEGVPVDGCVAKFNRFVDRQTLGNTSRVVRGCIALKSRSEPVETVIRDIVWSVTLNGRLVPTGKVVPVLVNGSTVKSVHLHNYSNFISLKFEEGDPVGLVLAGDVIPDYTEIRDASLVEYRECGSPWKYPVECPECCSSSVLIGKDLYCSALENCSGTIVSRLRRGLYSLGIEGFGAKVLTWCKAIGVCNIYQLLLKFRGPNEEDLIRSYRTHFGRNGSKTVRSLIEAVEVFLQASKAGEVYEDKILLALCIPRIGDTSAKEIIKTTGSLKKLFELYSTPSFPIMPEVSDITGQNLYNYFLSPDNTEMVLGLIQELDL